MNSGLSGLGPIKDKSPFRTFNIWGNSSILVLRKMFPMKVTLLSFLFDHFAPLVSAEPSLFKATIERNFIISKNLAVFADSFLPIKYWTGTVYFYCNGDKRRKDS